MIRGFLFFFGIEMVMIKLAVHMDCLILSQGTYNKGAEKLQDRRSLVVLVYKSYHVPIHLLWI